MRVLGYGLAALLLASAARAQSAAAPSADTARYRSEITAAIEHYFRAGDENSAAELRAAFYPTAMMFWVSPAGKLTGLSQSAWQGRLDAAKADSTRPPVKAQSRRILWIEITGDAAAAKLHSDYPGYAYEDYVSLLRTSDGWRIVGKVFHRREPATAALPGAAQARADRTAIEAVLRAKFQAMDTNDDKLLGTVYHPRAMTYSVSDIGLVAVSIAEWQARFAETRASGVQGERAKRRIESVDITHDAALATFVHDFGDEVWVDYGSLLKIAGRWQIVGLLYIERPRP